MGSRDPVTLLSLHLRARRPFPSLPTPLPFHLGWQRCRGLWDLSKKLWGRACRSRVRLPWGPPSLGRFGRLGRKGAGAQRDPYRAGEVRSRGTLFELFELFCRGFSSLVV